MLYCDTVSGYMLFNLPIGVAEFAIAIHAVRTKMSERSRFFVFCFSCATLIIFLSNIIIRWQFLRLQPIPTRRGAFGYLLLSGFSFLDIATVLLMPVIILQALRLGSLRSRNASESLRGDGAAFRGAMLILLAFMPDIWSLAQGLTRLFELSL